MKLPYLLFTLSLSTAVTPIQAGSKLWKDYDTSAPTAYPTTDTPSSSPSSFPTIADSDEPSEAPTAAPTLSPTDNVSDAPSEVPTAAPSPSPTAGDSEEPSASPTVAPSTLVPTSIDVEVTPEPTGSPIDQRDDDEYEPEKGYKYTYKHIELFDKSSNDYKCWEAVETRSHAYSVQAKACDKSKFTQDWYYSKFGELKNRYYGDSYCLDHDVDRKDRTFASTMTKCTGGDNQAWNYVHYHFVSHHDGACIDLDRQGGGSLGIKDCQKDLKDQLHFVENVWFQY